jgi:UDP-glucose 4-epimerase
LEGVDAVFHLASHQPFSWDPSPFIHGNVYRTATLLEAMRLAGINRLINSSTFAVYGDAECLPVSESDPVNPCNIYEVTKYQAEMLARVYSDVGDFKTTVLRYSSVYGGRNRVGSLYYFIEMTLKREPIRLFARGKTIRDYVYVDDVVRVNLSCLSLDDSVPFDVFNIGSGDAMSTGDLVHLIFELAGSSTEITYVEDEHWRVGDLYLDISKAQRQLNYQPLNMRDGLHHYLQTLETAIKTQVT